jgi:hypothetical protein
MLSAFDPSFAQKKEQEKKQPQLPDGDWMWFSCTDLVRTARRRHASACRQEPDSEECRKAIAAIAQVCARCSCSGGYNSVQ